MTAPLTRAALASTGDRLFAHGTCTVCGRVSNNPSDGIMATLNHAKWHVDRGEARISKIGQGQGAVSWFLTETGAAAARTRADRERTKE